MHLQFSYVYRLGTPECAFNWVALFQYVVLTTSHDQLEVPEIYNFIKVFAFIS